MTKINVKLLTTSTTVITGSAEDYTMKIVSQTADRRIKEPANREEHYKDIDVLAIDLGMQLANTISKYFRDGHTFSITIKDFLNNSEQ